ncbi:MAG TPA: hypothetical protein VGL21_10225 [Jatrophihabitantaceae bacterium]|jgi:hypothetical protein
MVPEERDRRAHRIADIQLRGGIHARVYWPAATDRQPPLLVLFGAGYPVPDVVLLATCPDDVGQAVDTVEWAADHAVELGADPGRVLLTGEPELLAAVQAAAQERGWPPVELFTPRTDEFRSARSS